MMNWKQLVGAASVLTFAAIPASATDYTYATHVGSEHVVPKKVLGPLFERLKEVTDGSLDFEILANGQLLSAKGMVAGIRDRLTDSGMVTPSYQPSELPYTNVLYDLQMLGDDVIAIAGATQEVMATDPRVVAEWKKNKMVLLGSYAIPSYVFMCKDEVVDVGDMEGKRVNATGGFSRFLVSIGAVPVNFSAGEAVQGLERGSIDCFGGSLAWVDTYSLGDLVDYVLDFPLTTPRTVALMAVNDGVWHEMSDSDREALWNAMPGAVAQTTVAYVTSEKNGRKSAVDHDVEMIKPGNGWNEARQTFLKTEYDAIAAQAKERGVDDAADLIADYEKVLAEWSDIAKQIDGDEAKFAEALRERIYDKIDPNAL